MYITHITIITAKFMKFLVKLSELIIGVIVGEIKNMRNISA